MYVIKNLIVICRRCSHGMKRKLEYEQEEDDKPDKDEIPKKSKKITKR